LFNHHQFYWRGEEKGRKGKKKKKEEDNRSANWPNAKSYPGEKKKGREKKKKREGGREKRERMSSYFPAPPTAHDYAEKWEKERGEGAMGG